MCQNRALATMTFASRTDAGQRLGRYLAEQNVQADLVLGLPRGGVIVAAEVAAVLKCPLDALVVRKIGHPGHREFAVGALAGDGTLVLDEEVIERTGVSRAELRGVLAEETERLLAADNRRPALVIQPARWSADALAASLDQQQIPWRPAPWQAGLIVEGRRTRELPGFASGAFYVQDPAQALAVRFFDVPEGAVVLDACGAPGGKAIALSARAGYVAAADLRFTRANRLRENLLRAASGAAGVLVADALAPPIRPVDAVLLDAPCLGTGSFARHPDARWRVTTEALALLAARAGRLLSALAEVVRPDGLLLFATCSLEPEENEVQIEAFLGADRRFRREPSAAVPEELLTPEGDLFLLPQRHGTDGAYAARLRRIG